MSHRLSPFVLSVLMLLGGSVVLGQIQQDLSKIYGSRWIPLPMPDSRIGPGAIVSIKKGEVAWESSLDKCGAPPEVMTAVASNDTSVASSAEGEYGANAALKIAGVTLGPDFKKVKKTSLKLEGHHAVGLDRITLGEWLNKPGMVLSPVCKQLLTQKGIFIVQEAYQVSQGKMTLYDEKNAKLSLAGLSTPIIKLDGGAASTKISNDAIEFSTSMFTAIRRVQLLNDGSLKTMGTAGPEVDADKQARALLYPPAGKIK
jgi:hypothetical protein